MTALAYTVATAAEAVSLSQDTIRRAIRKTKDDGEFPPPLPAKRITAGYRIKATDLTKWLDSLPDA